MNFSKDFAGSPIFEIQTADGLTRFLPYNIDTISEYLKYKQEIKEMKERPRSGAV